MAEIYSRNPTEICLLGIDHIAHSILPFGTSYQKEKNKTLRTKPHLFGIDHIAHSILPFGTSYQKEKNKTLRTKPHRISGRRQLLYRNFGVVSHGVLDFKFNPQG
jgi:hypothetical protein